MSENKFLERLRGTGAKRSVLEIKNQNTITTFANMPNGTSNPNVAFSDHRGNTTTPLRGTDNWQITSQNVLGEAGLLYGDGRDITTEFNVSGNTLWIDAGYTFIAPKLFTPNTKFVLKLCGHGMFSPVEKHIKFIFLIKFSNGYLITKDFVVKPEAFNFSKEFVIDFDNSEANVIKMVPGDKMTVQLLCADGNAYATIYGGMTVFTALQRRVNSESVASETLTFEEVANAIGDLQTAVDGKVDRVGDTMTGPLKFKSESFSGAISGYFNGISFYKLDATDNVILIGSFRDTDLSARNTGTTDLGTSSIKWRTLYALKLNNGADLAIPTQGGTLARIEDVPSDISDLSDVQTNNPQVGDYLRWNGQYWYNAAGSSGATVNWGQIGGDIMDQPDLQAALADKANVDLDNLSATGQAKFDAKANVDMDNLTSVGQNIANWSSNVTNCITEIPQDIILELNSGTVTLKAGSKIYNGNGLLTTIANDLSTSWASTGTVCLIATADGSALIVSNWPGYSVASLPSPTTSYKTYYNTTDGKCYFDNGTWQEVSFPVAVVSAHGQIDSIDRVFNGSGYIGSVVFALLDKGQIADGRNADGTLKSTAVSQTSIATFEVQDISRADVAIFIKSDHTLLAWGRDGGNVVSLATKPAVAPTTYCRAYIEDENLWYHSYATTAWEARDGTDEIVEICAVTTDANRRITNFRPKSVFRADMNNSITGISQIMNLLYPVGAIYIGTQATCPLATLIPGSTWSQIQGRYLLASGTLMGTSETYYATNIVPSGLPNITGSLWVDSATRNNGGWANSSDGAFYPTDVGNPMLDGGDRIADGFSRQHINAYRSSSVYGQSQATRAPGYVVNVWRRTA